MPRPTARVLALLELLQGGGIHKLSSLAERIGVEERTVRRYLDHLLDLGIPVESQRGRYGGYRLAPGFRLPPIMLGDDEALAVLVALSSRSTSAAGPDPAASALAKILRVLPDASRSKFEALSVADFAGVATSAMSSQPVPVTDAAVLLTVAEAAGQRRPLLVRYEDREGRGSHRVLLPYGLVARAGRWYLSAADSLSGEVRTFRVDRIRSAAPQEGVFELPPGIDPAEQVRAALAQTPWRHRVQVRVEATAEYVRERIPDGIAAITELDAADSPRGVSIEGWVLLELRAERLNWIPPLLASLDRPFIIDSPEELLQQVHALGRRLISTSGMDM